MPIVLISEFLPRCSTVADGHILCNRPLYDFCVRMNARKCAFKMDVRVTGKWFRMLLGYVL
jgi:hypothetical protein